MLFSSIEANSVNTVSQLIQLSIAPVFLLAGVAGFLNVFTTRITRIIDKIDKLDKFVKDNPNLQEDLISVENINKRREFLTKRMNNTNLAILFVTTTGLLISLVIVVMFLSAIFGFKDSLFIAILFILAISCLTISLILFLKEVFSTTLYQKIFRNIF